MTWKYVLRLPQIGGNFNEIYSKLRAIGVIIIDKGAFAHYSAQLLGSALCTKKHKKGLKLCIFGDVLLSLK
jgi:hypothetical protein